MIGIKNKEVDLLTIKAKKSEKKRTHYLLHKHTDPVLKLINVMDPDTYVRPHKHRQKNRQELFVPLRGRFIVILFDKRGKISKYYLIGGSEEYLMVEVPPNVWHTTWSLSFGSVLLEVIKGPYTESSHKVFASWAPNENSREADIYKKNILRKLKL